MSLPATPAPPRAGGLHLPCLLVAVLIMLAATLYPLAMTHADAQPSHGLALALFMAMSAGFVRGVGFIPVGPLWRVLFSGHGCIAWLAVAAALKLAG